VKRIEHVAVVIATRDRPALVADTVASILAGDAVPAEIVVGDQSARPGALPDGGGRCTVRRLHLPPTGSSASRNAAAAAAGAPVLAFVDDDILVAPGWLAALAGALDAGGGIAVATGRVVAGPPETPHAFQIAIRDDPTPAVYVARQRLDVLAGGNMAIARTVFERAGGFDERLGPGTAFPAAEDNDLSLRLLDAGETIVYVPEALVVHRTLRPPRDYLRVRFAYGIGQGAFYAKHARTSGPYISRRAAGHVLHYALRLPVRAVRAPRRAAGDAVFVAGLAVGAARWTVAERRR
jgi:GT2 family glycosyltransferase